MEGRHPVMERVAAPSPSSPTTCALGDDAPRLFILTGPNMGGKSTFLRQTALIALMAQMGSFVPAREAQGSAWSTASSRASAPRDHILRGQSTFMVEMQETAHILRHATAPQPGPARRDRPRHRHLRRPLDRLGGGRAHRARPATGRKTLFATHYHELTDLAADLPGVGNLHVSAREWKDGVVFLRKIEPGGSDRSFGIQVARLAGLPAAVVVRAQEILRNLERTEFDREGRPRLAHPRATHARQRQLALFSGAEEAVLAAAAGRRRPADAARGAGAAGRAEEARWRSVLDPPRHAPYTPGRAVVAIAPAGARADEACA